MTASAFSLSALYPLNEFEVTAGSPVIGGLHGATRHYFCSHCMSWLYTRPEGADGFVNVRATVMENAQSFRPFAETCTDEMLPWATTGAELSFEKFPSQAEFPILLEAFTQR